MLPALQCRRSGLVVIEVDYARIYRRIRFRMGLLDQDFLRRIVPSGFKPTSNLLWWFGRTRQDRTLNLYNEFLAVRLSGLLLLGLGSNRSGLGSSPLDRRVVGQPV